MTSAHRRLTAQHALCSWADAKLLPGALRVLRHLHHSGLPIAVATSTPRTTLQRKLVNKPELRELLARAVCGDEVGGALACTAHCQRV